MTVLILRHTPNNTLGDLVEVLEAHGLRHHYWEAYAMAPEAFRVPANLEGLVVLGGPMSVNHAKRYKFLRGELPFVKDVIDAGLPVFGICLGAQIIAKSLGATVELNPVKEIGWTPISLTPEGESDPVLSVLGQGTSQFQWHEDTFHTPDGAVSLASTPDCPRQAFRLGSSVYGVQFHPEVTLSVIQTWLSESRSLSLERKEAIWRDTELHHNRRQQLSRDMFHRFCNIAFTT